MEVQYMQPIMITPESSAWEGKWNACIFPRETGNKADS